LVVTVTLGGYNFIYGQEVPRIERNVGVTLPPFVHKFLRITMVFSFGLSLIVAFMALISFFFPAP
jgi:hypothetical protein